MSVYDRQRAAELVLELRPLNMWLTRLMHTSEIAAQLEAAGKEVERLTRLQAATVRIATEEAGVRGERFVNLQQANDSLRAENERLRSLALAADASLAYGTTPTAGREGA